MKKTFLKLCVVIPMRNSSSTIVDTLDGIRKQTYPVEEIVVVDNASTDNSAELVEKYIKRYKSFPLKLLKNKKDLMIARSILRGVHATKAPYIIFTQADITFVTTKEIEKLVKPFEKDQTVIATYGSNENPVKLWMKYPFWEKVLMSYDTGRVQAPGFLGKDDCIQRKAYLSVGGHDIVSFDAYGCEDANLHLRLKKRGKIVKTNAKVYHSHYLHPDFGLGHLFWKKKFTASGYGRFLRVHKAYNDIWGMTSMLIKLVLAIGSLIPGLQTLFIPLVIIFPFIYYKRMFTTSQTLRDPRILLLPFIGIILIYYEAFWTVKTFLEPIKSLESKEKLPA